jgi:toxin ParE1/3/4
MTRYRLSRLAEADLIGILAASSRRWGADGRSRYASLLVAAMRKIAAEPEGPATRRREELRPGIRSFHLRHARSTDPEGRVETPGPRALLPRGHPGSDRDRAGVARAHGAEPAPGRGFRRPLIQKELSLDG